MEMESVFLDNLPDTANMILNILWDRNEEMICRKEAYSMSDKNPKHPLKKKKAAAKINIADHAAVEEAREAHKSKKHVY